MVFRFTKILHLKTFFIVGLAPSMLTPAIFETGKSGRKCTPMTKAGNAHIRKMLFFPAMSAMKYNPICKEFAERLEAKGKPKIVILGAVMNKLLHLIFGVLKHQKPFNPEHLKKC